MYPNNYLQNHKDTFEQRYQELFAQIVMIGRPYISLYLISALCVRVFVFLYLLTHLLNRNLSTSTYLIFDEHSKIEIIYEKVQKV